MTVQFSRQAMAALSGNLAKTGSGLVRRLVRARNDPGKERIRKKSMADDIGPILKACRIPVVGPHQT